VSERGRGARRSQAGVTLIELMIGLVIVSIAVAATFAVGSSLNRSFREHRLMIRVTRVARGSLDYIADALRQASPGVGTGQIVDVVRCTGESAILVGNSATGSDSIGAIWAAGGVYTQLTAAFDEDDTAVTVADTTGFAPFDYAVITDGTIGHLVRIPGAGVTSATAFNVNSSWNARGGACAAMTGFPGDAYPAGSMVIRAMFGVFRVENSAATGNVPTLVMDDTDAATDLELLAQGVEDLQVAVGHDANGDGVVSEVGAANDDDEWHHNIAFGGAAESDPPPVAASPWRAVRVNVAARSVVERSESAAFTPFTLEDHVPTATPDVYRRRVASTVVEIRNLKGTTQ
jgi:prepilin-type N-terminal cleavage/methylation domain-containing protein